MSRSTCPRSGSSSTGPSSRPRASGSAPSWTTTTASSAWPGNCIPACLSARTTSRTRTASCSSSPAGGGSWASPATFGTSRRPRPTGPASRPSPLLSLIHVLEWRAAIQPGAIALSDQQGAELTYAGLADAVDRTAAGFAAAGVAPGDVVPVIARNQVGWVTAMLGLIRAGALPAAVNWRLAAPEVAALLRLAGPAAVLADADCAALARQAAAGLDRPVPIHDPAGQPSAADGALSPVDGARLAPPERPVSRLRPSEPAILVHTSGTTGRPKLVPLTHQQLITAVVFMKLEVPEAVPGARHLSALPLFHVAGLANLSYTLFTGGHLHLLAGFDPAGFYRTGDGGTLDADGYLTIVDRLIDLVSWARERLAGFKCPTGATVVPEPPRNATGKVLRAALREPFWAGRDRLVS